MFGTLFRVPRSLKKANPMLTVLPENLLVSEIVQDHLSFHKSIHVGRVNKELHARTFLAVKGFYADQIKRVWSR